MLTDIQKMDDFEIHGLIWNKLQPREVRDWFDRSAESIGGDVIALARADGIAVAVNEVKNLFLAYLQASKTP
jgi:hypothetical protein